MGDDEIMFHISPESESTNGRRGNRFRSKFPDDRIKEERNTQWQEETEEKPEIEEMFSGAEMEPKPEHFSASTKPVPAREAQTESGKVKYFLAGRARTNRKPDQLFACDDCGKMFTTYTGLYFHRPHHTGEWKYQCDVCDKGYMQLSKYRDHIQSHRKQFHASGRP